MAKTRSGKLTGRDKLLHGIASKPATLRQMQAVHRLKSAEQDEGRSRRAMSAGSARIRLDNRRMNGFLNDFKTPGAAHHKWWFDVRYAVDNPPIVAGADLAVLNQHKHEKHIRYVSDIRKIVDDIKKGRRRISAVKQAELQRKARLVDAVTELVQMSQPHAAMG